MNSKNTNENLPKAPIADKKDSVITFHDHSRNDQYFWMRLTDEQKNATNKDEHTNKVLEYLNAENDYSNSIMKETEEIQDELYNEIIGRIKQNDESIPYFDNGYWYYTRYEENKDYAIHCRKLKSLDANEEIILNVNEMAEGYTYYSATGLQISPNNKILAYSEDTISRRQYVVKFKNLETGEIYGDVINNTNGGGAWANDNISFFYTTKNKTSLLTEKIWKHTLGEDSSKDELKYHEKDQSFYIGVYRSKSGKYIIVYNNSTLTNDYHIINADNPNENFKSFTARENKLKYRIEHFKDKFYVITNWNALNFRLMETSIDATSKENWEELIAHREDVYLNSIEVFDNHLVVSERTNALTQLKIINHKTQKSHFLKFNEPAYVVYSSTNKQTDTELLRFGYSSLTTPNTVYDYNMNTKEKTIIKQEEVVGGHIPENYVSERIFVEGRDGTKIPISLVYKKGFNKDGNSPIILYAYGSYGSTIDPWFGSTRISLLDRGFVWAIAHVRGGQILGRKWYEDGKMFNKINSFNDYIDCAKYLIDKKYTSAKHLYGYGGSAGGLLVGAVANMAPELFNGMIAAVPFVDVINTMLDESIPLTTNEFDEWGNPKNKDSYSYMLSYSPYDNVLAHEYPNMLVTTGLFDSQVQYWEPAKWVAKLRDIKTDNNILLLKTNMESGHGGASGRFKRYKETALNFAFFLKLEHDN